MADLLVPLYDAYVAVDQHKIYITGVSPIENAIHQVYVYDTNNDQWTQMPPSGHYLGIPHIIGGKLVIIGGRLSSTKRRTNKVSTFDEKSQTWRSFYPDLLSVRSKPGVVSHLEYVIVAGGDKGDDITVTQDNIEVLNWIENSHWRKVVIKLPAPIYGFIPTISDDYVLMVGYYGTEKLSCYGTEKLSYNGAYKIPVARIVASIDQADKSDISAKWIELTVTDHWRTAIIPSSSPPVVVGGDDKTGTITSDIKMYDNTNRSWKKIASLPSARCSVAVAMPYSNAIIVIGGSAKGGTMANRNSSSLTTVELGQVELTASPTLVLNSTTL